MTVRMKFSAFSGRLTGLLGSGLCLIPRISRRSDSLANAGPRMASSVIETSPFPSNVPRANFGLVERLVVAGPVAFSPRALATIKCPLSCTFFTKACADSIIVGIKGELHGQVFVAMRNCIVPHLDPHFVSFSRDDRSIEFIYSPGLLLVRNRARGYTVAVKQNFRYAVSRFSCRRTDFPISQSRPVANIKRDVRPCRSTRIHIHLIEHFNEAPREIIRDRDADRTTRRLPGIVR